MPLLARIRKVLSLLRGAHRDPWERFVRTNAARLLAVARGLTQSDVEAEAAVQAAFRAALLRGGENEVDVPPETWLLRLLIGALEGQGSVPGRYSSESLAALLARGPGRLRSGGQVAQEAVGPDATGRFRAALRLLPTEHGCALVLRDAGGLEDAEIGQVLGLSPLVVRCRIHQARAALVLLLA